MSELVEEQPCKHDADCGCLKQLADMRLNDIKEMQEELDIFMAALEEIAEMKGKTILGCNHDEYHRDCDGREAHEIGANKAFNQAAEIAIKAISRASQPTQKENK